MTTENREFKRAGFQSLVEKFELDLGVDPA
jgi:hypothetical protein